MSEHPSADPMSSSDHVAAGDEHPTAATEPPSPSPHPLRRIVRLLATAIFFYVMLVEVVLLVGFVCLLVGIEPSSWFVDWVYRSVDRTMQPFRGLFTSIQFGTGSTEEVRPTVESSIVFAMIVYGIIALAAHDLAEWLGRPGRH